jgi:hypothetical protein
MINRTLRFMVVGWQDSICTHALFFLLFIVMHVTDFVLMTLFNANPICLPIMLILCLHKHI